MALVGFLQPKCLRWRLCCGLRWQVLIFLLYFSHIVSGQIRYSIQEEMKKGSLIGNVALDLGLDLKRLRVGRARIVTGESIQYTELKTDKGILVVSERIDREQLCGDITPCSFSFEIILETPMELHRVTVEILDVNDHAPIFPNNHIKFEISESATLGSRFVLESAEDHDVGFNGLQNYVLTPNDNFILKQHANPDGRRFAEMILQKPLDREEHPRLSLKLIAVDGGNPQRSGTVNIEITVLDANDNAPVFNQSVYRATVMENAQKGTYITTLNASDADSGSNGLVTYSFSNLKGNLADIFEIDRTTGKISVAGQIDFEKDKKYEIRVEAKDQGGLTDLGKVVIEIVDINDNAPVINVMSFSSPVSEDAPLGTTINPIEFYRVTVEINDINDNAPVFQMHDMKFEISESAITGAKFVLERAFDSDIGLNGLQTYLLNPTDNFVLKLQGQADGIKKVEMVLQKPLDREKQEQISLVLTALDGGEPHMSGTVQIHVTVLDANDNAPVFTQAIYKASLIENSKSGTLLTTVSATDIDHGSNGLVTYSISSSTIGILDLFEIDERNGEVRLINEVDYETAKHYQIDVKAKDQGGLTDSSKLIVDIIDVNDNKPLIDLMSTSKSIPENVPSQTVIAVMSVHDPDSDNNGVVNCVLTQNIPFTIKSTSNGFYSLVTDSDLDRERAPEYNISVTCSDEGVPSLSSSVTLTLQISDVNDNAPVFERSSYEAYIIENNTPGLSIFTVKARDADWNQNARVSYILEDSSVNGVPVSSYVSVSADSGVIQTVRSFDYEQIKDFQFRVKAQDGGSPPLSSNVTVKIMIQDQNDNAPQVLYPVQTSSTLVAEMVPRSADVGYLVTKVVAVDVDSGQNAWLSYKLQKATDRGLFEVGLQNGEIRTIRQVTDKDAVKQRITVVVEDNGQPSRSFTVNLKVAVADNFPEVLSDFTDVKYDKDYNDNLTFYLVLALAVVSLLFITCLLHVYNYEVCRTTDSRKSDSQFARPCSQNVLIMDPSSTGTMQRMQSEKNILDEPDSPIEVWKMSDRTMTRQVLLFISVLSLSSVHGQVSYSIPEEMVKGSLVGNIAQDLGLDIKRLKSGKARIYTGDSAEYIELNKERGVLLIK
uniref:Cadherin domain-containing protein n=1 Tax=Hucho hucho TaxID=62062 RepID=A0A4W5L9L2_9TELE